MALHAIVKIKLTRNVNGAEKSKIVENTVGRFIFNEAMPQDVGFVDRTVEGNEFYLNMTKR